jgi:tetratricopeptide (TPR) repeat protein
MPSFRQITIVALTALTLVSCRRDPNIAKKRYVESGDKYFSRGRFNEAGIQYQNAVKIDPRYGLAYFKLAEVNLKAKPSSADSAVRNFRKAIELLKGNQAYQEEYQQAMVTLSDLYLVYANNDTQLLDEVKGYCDQLFKKDPNSFDAFRLTGDRNLARFKQAAEAGNSSALEGLLDAAMENYRKAEAVKPNDPGVAMQIGLVLRQQKRYAEAEPYFRKVIEQNKTASSAYLNLYRIYMTEGKTADGEQLLKQGVQNNPTNPEYLERLAYHYGALGRRDDMVSVLQQIKAHAKDWDGAYQLVGNFYVRINDTESALREYREAVVKDPKHKAGYQHSIIEVLMRQGKRAEAAEMNSQILKENPRDPDAKSLAASFLLDQGDVNKAISELQAVVTSAPDNAVAHYQLGRAYLASGRSDSREAARQQFEKAIQLRRDMITPRLGLAYLQVMHNEYQLALDSVQEILKLDPGSVNARLIESQALLGLKKYGDSDTLLSTLLKNNPSSPEVYYQAGMSALTQGKLKEAAAAFLRSYELNPANPRGLVGLVQTDIQAGKPEDAMVLLQTESKKQPNRMDIQLLMGVTAQQEGKYSDALTYFNRVLNGLDKKSRTRANLYMQIADTYRRQGDRDNSIVNLMKARDIVPDNETVLASLGLVLDQAGRKPDARRAYEACLKVDPNNTLVLNNLAYLMAETNAELDVALNYAQKAKGLDPNLAEVSDTYGWILLKKGLAEQAIPVFRDLVSKVPADSTYHYHLAMAYSQKMDTKNANEELREALKHSPSKDEQQRIQELLVRLSGR